ncbi:hypothetical protein TRVA0_006S02366 [Trichomonascus vanleenenianus]|uniref:snapin/pallidin family protein n=1 Tax=Trichomonascus vanleenenianus TaxID=2268995 RepID=UPI003ECB9259
MSSNGEDPVSQAFSYAFDYTMENTAHKLETLHASQVALSTQLTLLTNKLEEFRSLSEPADIGPVADKISRSKKRLYQVNALLEEVYKRLEKVDRRLNRRPRETSGGSPVSP